ncbi:hypothetical protein VPNG_00819 [Cytospora leucostoma]|uniref:Carboxylic ester hydrolase n=1 Tax=Cytospora leucostoma TaxID=1230097 RepID=A0A423XM30_9PEZI|nr:hypothetical protein VPNG_00819 [Cytospora leucostoma]
MYSFRSLCCLILSGAAYAVVLPRNVSSSAPVVNIKNGSYYGVHSSEYDQDFFFGVPFAQPPVGDLRLRQPQSLNTTWTGVRNATEIQPECYGYGPDQWRWGNRVSEDCLTTNIIRPAGISTDAALPVGLFLVPGGYFEGGNLDPRYNFSFIIQQAQEMGTPFLAVMPNYRVSLWGFLYGQEVVDAGITNLGMLDQRLAMHWVQENIAAFGGDPNKVTIWGESAGAGSVSAHLVAYGGRDDKLFRSAIAESSAVSRRPNYPSIEEWQPVYNEVVDAAQCTNATDTLACLRTVPADTLNTVFNTSNWGSSPNFGPQIDGDFLQASQTTHLRRGEFVKVPYLTGANHDEGTSWATKNLNTTEDFLSQVVKDSPGVDNETLNTIAVLYPDIPAIGIPATLKGRPSADSGYGLQWKRAASYTGDLAIHAARRLAAQCWAQYNTTLYSYHWNVLVNGQSAEKGAGHWKEIAFVFDDITGLGYNSSDVTISADPFEGEPESFLQLATIMSRMWVSFIVNGDPNQAGVTDVEWPEYSLEDPRNLVFDVNRTDIVYIEPDLYRANGIAYISDRLETVFGS